MHASCAGASPQDAPEQDLARPLLPYLQVVLPLPVDKPYTYRVPEALRSSVQIGCRVVVPFGARMLTGLVVGRTAEKGPYTLKPIHDVLDEAPAFTEELLGLTRWIASYYACSWGEAVRAALPGGIEVESRRRIYPADPRPPTRPDARTQQILAALAIETPATVDFLNRTMEAPVTLSQLRRIAEAGWIRIENEIVPPRVRIKTERRLRLAPALHPPEALEAALLLLRGEKQRALLAEVARLHARGDPAPRQAEVLKRVGAGAATAQTLVRKNVLELVTQEVIRTPLGDWPVEPGPAPVYALHTYQRDALKAIRAALDARRFEAFLLHGVTGSGKTEVYIAALKQVLGRGQTGIVLVPEIALTPQTVQRFRAHFGDQVAVLHSQMSAGERYDVWRQLRKGVYRVVIGPRSAVLAPLENLGLIVVDEEHEASYKQFDPAPRYHARDVAVMRAHLNGAVCILGSATPSIESYMNATRGKYTLLPMPLRVPVPGRPAALMPVVEIVDLALEKRKHQLDGTLSKPLQEAIARRLANKEQVILLQNRRGYAPVLECQDCGWTPHCRDCAVTLTYHKPRAHLRCHYCGYTQRIPARCPTCHGHELEMLGLGTQRVEEELHTRFPAATVLRMDLDTTSKKGAHRRILEQFGRGAADILIGTQMIAKGLDFKQVTLVGVINADTGLLMPDFRAAERTFQLLTQVAGRAGRDQLRGDVILQTRNPKHPVIRFACNHDYLGFIETDLPDRKQIGYPPFGRLIGVEFRGPDLTVLEQVAQKWTQRLRSGIGHQASVLGPELAFISRVKRQYRMHTILKVPPKTDYAGIKAALHATTRQTGSLPKDVRIAIDVDPVGLF